MENIKKLKTASEVRSAICSLGHFVNRSVNGKLELEFDLINSCNDMNIIGNKLFPSGNEYREAYFYKGIVGILYNNGTLVEIEASPRKYYTREEVYEVIEKLYENKSLIIVEQVLGRKISPCIMDTSIDEVKDIIDGLYQESHSICRDFIVLNNQLQYQKMDSETGMITGITIADKLENNEAKIKRTLKIIQSNKFKSHMKVHESEFSVSYTELIQYMKNNGKFNDLQDDFIEMIVEFPFNIGYSNLCETNVNDTIVYAKRKDRELYTRFTLDGKKEKTNTCVVILRKSFVENDEYCMVKMFPGKYLIKEPEDKNFKSEKDRQAALKFWDNHALVFEPKTIDLESLKYICPYKNYFIMI